MDIAGVGLIVPGIYEAATGRALGAGLYGAARLVLFDPTPS